MEDLTKLTKRNIIIDNKREIKLMEQTLFLANGEEGLHLWESAVVLSRYIVKYSDKFNGKNILELGCGCGLLGLSCLMFTQCNSLVFSDYQDSVLTNLLTNIEMNKFSHSHILNSEEKGVNKQVQEGVLCPACLPGRYSLLKLDWRDYEKYKLESYDFLIGSELIYSGGHIEELAKIIRNLLKHDGKALICMPEKRSMTKSFLNYLDENELDCNYKYIEEFCESNEDKEYLFTPILKSEKESKKLFENLNTMKIMLYEISRKI
jgi:predicted nicotinamide N-methyase